MTHGNDTRECRFNNKQKCGLKVNHRPQKISYSCQVVAPGAKSAVSDCILLGMMFKEDVHCKIV